MSEISTSQAILPPASGQLAGVFERLARLQERSRWSEVATPEHLTTSATVLAGQVRANGFHSSPELAGPLAAEMILIGMQLAQVMSCDLLSALEEELAKREQAAARLSTAPR